MSRNTKKQKGIVLVEAIVAIGVLATIFTATMSLYLSSIKSVRMTNDQVIATFLAQDALEQVVAKKQYNYYNYRVVTSPMGGDGGWLDDLAACIGNNCAIDYINNDLNDAGGISVCGANCPLYLTGGVYSSTGAVGTESYFSRWITISRVGDEARVTAVVSWNDGSTPMQYSLNYNIYRNPNIK